MFEAKGKAEKKIWFWISIVVNLGFLGFFKYYNFFIGSFADLLSSFGFQSNPWTLQIILPVGISFYTFHGMSYVIDIYYDRIKPTTNFIDYSVFVSFFPLLVAGPIERATHLLPQIQSKRNFNLNQAVDGSRQILWGLFKKIVIADNCAPYVNDVFTNYEVYSGSTLALGAIFFAFQIYGDFSGYSDIALGVAKLFGINLLRNFAYPYFSRDIAEFWRRWHISLTTWFRDYVYIPLGGSRGSIGRKILNTFIIFGISGFWHGANWTFIFWGLLNAAYFIPYMLTNTNRKNLETVAKGKMFPTLNELFQMTLTFTMCTVAWIFFRSETMTDAFLYIQRLFSSDLFTIPQNISMMFLVILFIFLAAEWVMREKTHALQITIRSTPVRWAIYFILSFAIFTLQGANEGFIYFQF
ncbi:MAG TPA: MBOAT family O-acyltransferase [Chryseosolibacter sp.]